MREQTANCIKDLNALRTEAAQSPDSESSIFFSKACLGSPFHALHRKFTSAEEPWVASIIYGYFMKGSVFARFVQQVESSLDPFRMPGLTSEV